MVYILSLTDLFAILMYGHTDHLSTAKDARDTSFTIILKSSK
jgi:hypothetical protein